MKTAVVINTLLKGDRWTERIGSLDPVEALIEKLNRWVKKDNLFFVTNDVLLKHAARRFEGYNTIKVDKLKTSNVFREIYKALGSYNDAVYLFIDTPLIDLEVLKEMVSLHHTEYAEYTYGEGFPVGVVPEVLNIDLFAKCAALTEKDHTDIGRESLFDALSKEINSFDIGTYFAPRDLKLMRLELSTSLKRNRLLVQRIAERAGIECSYRTLCELIDGSPEIVRTLPSYFEIEITNRVNGSCIYSPLCHMKRGSKDMRYEDFTTIVDKIREFSETAHVAFSYLGEPLLHRELKKFIEYTLSQRDLNLILETDGLLLTPDFSDYFHQLHADNLHIIIEIDAVKEETYQRVRDGNLNSVERNARFLLSRMQKNVYVQMVRLDENEQEMIKFFDVWEKEGAKVIIQKYNSYLGLLPSLSHSDLRPLDRMPCWHLLRDMVAFFNGDVPRCKQDINCLFPLGNLLNEDIEAVWERGKPFYLQHTRKDYDSSCKMCDEYFVFNF